MDRVVLFTALILGVLTSAEAARVHRIPRAREVGQSSLAAVWGTARGFVYAISVVYSEQPQLLLVNGPGTCIPVCVAAVLLRCLCLAPRDLTIVFLESVCRVDSLSVSGHLVYWLCLADVVAVQWQALKTKFPGAVYVGLQV